jgi:6-pyruvoyltetrahydropterin/6-carboxytetrahydropterin synthase
MPYATLTRIFTFESAHQLPNHRGKCARLHGHSYRLEVAIRGPLTDMAGASDEGMVLDLLDLKRIVQEAVIERLDHQNLNEVIPCRTTVENIAHWIWRALSPALGDLLFRLRLWETATGYVEVLKNDV